MSWIINDKTFSNFLRIKSRMGAWWSFLPLSTFFRYFGEKIWAMNIRKILMCCWGWEDTKKLFTEESLWKVSRFSRWHILQPVNFNAQHSWTRKFCEKYLLCKTESTSKDPFENSFQNFHALCHISCIPIQYAFVSYLLCQIYWGFSCITILHQLKEFEIKEEWYWISKC